MKTVCTRFLRMRRRHAAPTEESADSSTSHEVAVREQEPVALLEETRQTFTIIREKFSLRSRK